MKIENARSSGSPILYKAITEDGNGLYVSTANIRRSQFAGIVDNCENEVTILSGTHGNMNDEFVSEINGIKGSDLLQEDIDKCGNSKDVTIYYINKLSNEEIEKIISSSKTTVCSWCFSEHN